MTDRMTDRTNLNIPDQNQIQQYISHQKDTFYKLISYFIYICLGFSIIFFPLRNDMVEKLMSYWWIRIAILCLILYIGLDNKQLLISAGLSILYILGMNTYNMREFPLVA
jgi:hypothetical protein